jgi:hypothetical protein
MPICSYCEQDFDSTYGRSIHQGRKHPEKETEEAQMPEAHKKKISQKLKGRERDSEVVEKIAESLRGRSRSTEAKKKMSRNTDHSGKENPMFGVRGKENPISDGEIVNCSYCGSKLYRKRSRLKSENYYCNFVCKGNDMKGRKNVNWQGGKPTYYPSEFTRKRESIIQRDGEECVRCELSRDEHYTKYGVDLNIHHIDGNKFNNSDENLVTLCSSCHTAVEKGEEYDEPE